MCEAVRTLDSLSDRCCFEKKFNGSFVAGNRLKAVADNATWRDIGAATGSLLGGSLLLLPDLTLIFLIAGAGMTSALVWHRQAFTEPMERFFKWK